MHPTRRSLAVGAVILAVWIAVMTLSTDPQKSGELVRFLAMVLGPSGVIGALVGRPLTGMAVGFGLAVIYVVVGILLYGFPC